VQIQVSVNGQSLPLMGPFTPPANFSFKSGTINITPATTALYQIQHVLTFGAGSGVGATIYNALTPGPSSGGGSPGDMAPTVCDSASADSPNCAVIACDGATGTLPIYRPARPRPMVRTNVSSGISACSTIGYDGGGGTLPILYPTGASGANGPLIYPGSGNVAETGAGSTLPILYPTGATGAGGSGVVIACDGSGGTLPIARPARPRAMVRTNVSSGISACSTIGFDGGGGTLPILYPTGASGANGPLIYPGSSNNVAADGTGSTLPIPYPTGATGAGGSGVVIAMDGGGGTLPISRPARPRPVARAYDSSGISACSTIGYDGGGSTLPILYPTGASGANGPLIYPGSCTDVACEGGGGTLPILYPTGATGAGGSGVLIAEDGSGGTLPIYRIGQSDAAPRAVAATGPFPIEIATPFESSAAAYSLSVTCSSASSGCWITIPITSGSIRASSRTAITATIDPTALPPGTYTANVAITITPQGGSASTVNVPVTLALAPTGPYLMLSQSGLQFQAAPGATVTTAQTIAVTNAGDGSLAFTATASTAQGNWLSVSPVSGTVTTSPAQVTITANPSGLAPGVYSGLVQFTASGGVNGTQSLEVTLTVSAAGPPPFLSSNALIFVANAGSNPAPQMVQLFNPTGQALTPSASIAYAGGSGWFTASTSGETVTSAQPLSEMINVTSASLAPGVYLGSMDIHLMETDEDELVEVVLIVRGSGCSPTRLLPVITNLGGGFDVLAGLPVPLVIEAVDDCGSRLTSGSAMAYFPGGDLGVPLTASAPGQWSGTWLPHATTTTAPATVGILATANGTALFGSAGVMGTIEENPSAPVVFSGGVVSSASFAEAPLAPGARVSIFGSNLAATPASNNTSPYPITLGGTQVLLGGEALPLQVATSGLINAIIPYDLPVGVPQQLIVQQGSQLAMPETLVLAAAQPAVFTQNESGTGLGVVVVIRPNGSVFENNASNPATAGDLLVIYATGLGLVSPAVPDADAAPLSPPSNTVDPVTVTIGGVAANVAFAGLAPEFVAAYQVNAIVPAGIAPGASVPLIVSAAGASSVPVTVAIH
jgi:trimeric autotransporter adhesin